MDQGFNDDELADIMNEIESLEKEFTDDSDSGAEQHPQDQKEELASKSEDDHEQKDEHHVEQQVVQLKEEQIESARVHEHDDDNIHHIKKPTSGSSQHGKTAVEFSVHGDMQLNLKFNVAGREITLQIDEHNFDIELEHGMKFNLPLTEKKSA